MQTPDKIDSWSMFQIHNMVEEVLLDPPEWKKIVSVLAARADATAPFLRSVYAFKVRLEKSDHPVTLATILRQGKIMAGDLDNEMSQILGRIIIWSGRRFVRKSLNDYRVSESDKDQLTVLRITYDLF